MSDEINASPDGIDRWHELSFEIAEYAKVGYPGSDVARGDLTVIGSGFSVSDFSYASDDLIRDADYVFYCLYDTMARIWINDIRPDALDLHVLYDQDIARYYTYVRMAETILHHVRLGKRVVAIYYGHPGVFATPAHRAVAIARSEGHCATMRPGVSALDYLIADVGFDPALPGLLTYEATDMLLRSRHLDPSLHVVLWQVGLVGDLGFAPKGFENRGFRELVAYISKVYGEDWCVTHYIAPKFRGLEPEISHISIGKMSDDNFMSSVSAISTFYIPPKEYRATDINMARLLGLADGSYELKFRDIDYKRYTSVDRDMIRSLQMASFKNRNYKVPKPGNAYRMLKELSQSASLIREYLADPSQFVRQSRWSLNSQEIGLLEIPHSQAFDAALSCRP